VSRKSLTLGLSKCLFNGGSAVLLRRQLRVLKNVASLVVIDEIHDILDPRGFFF